MELERLLDSMQEKFEDIVTSYYTFRANKTYTTRKKLLEKIKIFNHIKNNFTQKLREQLLKKEDPRK